MTTYFAKGNQYVAWDLDEHRDVGRVAGFNEQGILVDVVLNNSGIDHGQGPDEEAQGDTLLREKVDLVTTQEGVDYQIDNRDEDQQSNGIKVVHNVIGQRGRSSHNGSLRDQVVAKIVVTHPVDRQGQEDLARHDRLFEFIYELIVPVSSLLRHLFIPGRSVGHPRITLGEIHEVFA